MGIRDQGRATLKMGKDIHLEKEELTEGFKVRDSSGRAPLWIMRNRRLTRLPIPFARNG